MASQGPNSPSGASDDSSIGSALWSNITNIGAGDGNYATSNLLTSSPVETLSTYGAPSGVSVSFDSSGQYDLINFTNNLGHDEVPLRVLVKLKRANAPTGTIRPYIKPTNSIDQAPTIPIEGVSSSNTDYTWNFGNGQVPIVPSGASYTLGFDVNYTFVDASNFLTLFSEFINNGSGPLTFKPYHDLSGVPLLASHYAKTTNYGFSVPSSASIDGIVVEVERKGGINDHSVRDNSVRIVKSNGAIGSINKSASTYAPVSEAYASYGGASDLWGETWAPSDINSANFGAAISYTGGGIASADHMRITVYYTPATDDSASTSDFTSTSEAISISLTTPSNPSVSPSDAITVSESVAVQLINNVAVSDSITVSENLIFVTAGTIIVGETESITVTDTLTVGKIPNPVVSDSITVAENNSFFFPTIHLPSFSESVTTSEFVFINTNAPTKRPPRIWPQNRSTIAQTRIEVLDANLNMVTWVKSFVPLNKGGTILRYSKELSHYGMCTFRISSYDSSFTQLGDIVKPHAYHIRVRRAGVIVWQGAIIENTKRTKDFIEVVAAEYLWYLGKKLINRSSANPATGEFDQIYRIFQGGITMATAVTGIMSDAISDFQGTNHALASLSLGTVENPDYPPNMTDANTPPKTLTGPWTFGDGISSPKLTFDFHTILYVLKSFGMYTYADFNIDASLKFNFKKFLGNDHHYDVNFVYGQHGNAVDFNITRLGQRMVNQLWGIAVDTNGKILHSQQSDQPSIKANGYLEQVAAYSDIKDQGTLNSRIQAELPLISTPDSSADSIVLSEKSYPLGLYDIGDIITMKVNHIAIQYNQIRRIVGISVDLHSTGRELTTIQTNQPLPWQYGKN